MITTSLEAALLILTIEFGLLAGVVTFFAYRGARSVEAESVAQATELVSKVSNTEDTRRTALETVFKDKYQFEGDELGAAVDEFMQREKAFYNAVVGAFLGRGNSKISDLNDELTKIVAPWISITPKNMVDKGTAESLAQAKSEVEQELGETKQVLEKMMAEYNRAFQIDPSDDVDAQATNSGSSDASMDEAKEMDDVHFSVDLSDDKNDQHAAVDVSNDAAVGANESTKIGVDSTAEPVAVADTVEELDHDEIVAVAAAVEPAAEKAGDPGLANDMIEELDDDDEAPDPGLVSNMIEELGADDEAPDPGLVSDMIEELDDDDDTPAVEAALAAEASKPMTSDDLDELMESLESDATNETETA